MSAKREKSPKRSPPVQNAVLSQIFVYMPGVSNWTMDVFAQLETETPLIVLMRICQQKNLNIPISAFYCSLALNETLKSQGIKMGATIRFNVRCCANQVYIQYPNGTDQLYFMSKDLIELQRDIEERTGIPIRCQLLVSMFGIQPLVTTETYQTLRKEQFWYLYFKLHIINGNLDYHFPTQRQVMEKGFVFDKTEFEAYWT